MKYLLFACLCLIQFVGFGQENIKMLNKDSVVSLEFEVSPTFQGGADSLRNFLIRNVQYPEVAKQNEIHGVVYVGFVIEKDGLISNVKVLRGIGGGCDEEAIRVVKLMPKWNPGYSKGKPVRVSFVVPIKFMFQ
ncbi:MAG: energy transducer TonB [Bacteroidota bacterium]